MIGLYLRCIVPRVLEQNCSRRHTLPLPISFKSKVILYEFGRARAGIDLVYFFPLFLLLASSYSIDYIALRHSHRRTISRLNSFRAPRGFKSKGNHTIVCSSSSLVRSTNRKCNAFTNWVLVYLNNSFFKFLLQFLFLKDINSEENLHLIIIACLPFELAEIGGMKPTVKSTCFCLTSQN